MKGKKLLLWSIVTLTPASLGFAHGTDKPGPHGGSIQMPGAFHTELVRNKGTIDIYLLDMGFENPTTANSQLDARLMAADQASPLGCEKASDHFSCQLPPGTDPLAATIRILAVRDGIPGGEVIYNGKK